MKLLVHVIEARGLQSVDGTGTPYVRLQLGRRSSKTIATKRSANPFWDKKFSFKVGDLTEVLKISVQDEEKFFNDRSLGRLKIPLSDVLDANDLSLGTQWYKLRPKNKKAKLRDHGEIHLGISLSKKGNSDSEPCHSCSDEIKSNSDKSKELTREPSNLFSTVITESSLSAVENYDKGKLEPPLLVNQIHPFSNKRNSDSELTTVSTKDADTSEVQEIITDPVDSENLTFDKMLKELESQDQEMPENLAGGVLLDHSYSVSPTDLNSLLFSPTSNFWQSLADLQGTTGLQPEPWKLENENSSLSRVVTYTKAATKLVKAVKATEKQTYMKANGKEYAVLLSVSTPDVPFGNSFRTEILFCILPGPELPSKESSSTLVISWRTNFLQSTMMKGMIESGARQGLRDSYAQFSELLSQNIKLIDQKYAESSKDELLSYLKKEQESDLMLAFRFFGNFTVISSVFAFLYVVGHIMLAKVSKVQGLEFPGLDLPDSIGEVVVCGVLVLQGERVFNMISRYIQARKQRGSDNRVPAKGEGWLLTIALIEGSNLPAVNLAGYSDPYVVFSSNGKIKTSTIKFQTHDPQWNEIFVFDAMDDPPSMMDIDVYDFDGPFDEAISLGHAEVNFVKSNLLELADVWIPLQGKLAQPCQSKLHLRVFLNNTRGNDVTEYLMKMGEKVGKKINARSPQTNSAFQKIFNLPPEEFLINDFSCHLKRKMPLQGRLFLSPRIIGFYTNLFGHKTKFFFLWEDIEEIQIVPPSLASMGSPSIMIILCQGKGLDARHGAKSVDNDGRLRFQFQSFVSFSAANRTVMALWKARSLSPEQKVQIIENQSEEKNQYCEESESFLGVEDAEMSEVFSSVVHVPVSSLMELFEGNSIEQTVMEKVGYVDYSVTLWEIIKNDVYRRQVNYRFNKKLLRHGGRVTSTQQKTPLPDNKGWVIEELMVLQGIPLGDFFELQLRYHVQNLSPNANSCNVQVRLGISWLKGTSHQKRITNSVISTSSDRLKDIFLHLEKALLQESI